MPEILPLRPDQVSEARQVIYTVAHALFRDHPTLEEDLADYEKTWPIRDVTDFQQRYVENGGAFLALVDGERIVGTGALRRLEDGIGEIKRLWLLPEFQGQGLGYRLMLALISVAREKGYKKIRLETSPAYQPRAFAFYRQMGFTVIPRYGDDPDDVGMELVICEK